MSCTASSSGGRKLRPRKSLKPDQIDSLLNETDGLDFSDIDLSDEDECGDKSYEPLHESDPEEEVNNDSEPEDSEPIQPQNSQTTPRIRWKINEAFGTELLPHPREASGTVKKPSEYVLNYLPDSITN